MTTRGDRPRRVCLLLAAGLAIWATVIWFSDGITLRVGGLRLLSSRNPQNPAWLAVGLVLAWGVLAWRAGGLAVLRRDAAWAVQAVTAAIERATGGTRAWLLRTTPRGVAGAQRIAPCLPHVIAVAATAAAVIVASVEGVFVVGGADSYGYVSEAHLWAAGRVTVPEPLIAELQGLTPPEAAVPLGYRLGPDGMSIVPTYSPGFPLLMTLFEWIGGRDAVFAAVPVMAGLMVWATFLLGRFVGGAPVGAAAAVLVAASPTFLLQIVSPPMSDVPGAAWWTLALAAMSWPTAAGALLSGTAAGIAVLTRPNLVPLALVPLLVMAWPLVRTRTVERRAVIRGLLYSAGVVAGCLAVAAINQSLNGSPLLSGYGPLSQYYAWSHWAANLAHYPRWLVETQTPFIALAIVAPALLWLAHRRGDGHAPEPVVVVSLVLFVLILGVSYLFYAPFDSWVHLRFLLPAFPVLLVFLCVVVRAGTRRLPAGLSALAFAAAIGLLARDGYGEAREAGVFLLDTERKYALVGRYLAQRLPANAIVFAAQHSGSVRYYSGRKTVRWDIIARPQLTGVVEHLQARGYEPYLLVEEWETSYFRAQFAGHQALAWLSHPPVAFLPLGGIGLYAVPAPRVPGTETIPDPQ